MWLLGGVVPSHPSTAKALGKALLATQDGMLLHIRAQYPAPHNAFYACIYAALSTMLHVLLCCSSTMPNTSTFVETGRLITGLLDYG